MSDEYEKIKVIGCSEQGGIRGAQLWGVYQNEELRSTFQTQPGNDYWSSWSGLWKPNSPNGISALTACKQNNGEVQLWAITPDGVLHSICQNSPGGGWSEWTSNWNDAPNFDCIVACEQGGERGAQFWGVDTEGILRSCFQITPGGEWSSWSGNWHGNSPEGIMQLTACRQSNGLVQLWALTKDGEVYNTSQTSPGGGWTSWISNWNNVPELTHITACEQDGNQGIRFWGIDKNAKMGSCYQESKGGKWTAWQLLWTPNPHFISPKNVIQIASCLQNDGKAQLWALLRNGELMTTYQTGPTNWYQWFTMYPITAGGMVSIHYNWGDNVNFDNLETLQRIDAMLPNSDYFWAQEFHFGEGNGGYMGLQGNAEIRSKEEKQKIVIFSI